MCLRRHQGFAMAPIHVGDRAVIRRTSPPLHLVSASHLPSIDVASVNYLMTRIIGLQKFFPGLKAEDVPGYDGWALEKVEMCTHSGTHVDAPWQGRNY